MEHEEALNGFVRTLVPTREDAREVMQEVAVVLWRKFEELSAMEDFRRWKGTTPLCEVDIAGLMLCIPHVLFMIRG